jgi:catechol 2,3-dioxygenase-like lactoylglutathione lyase family enzyme
LAAAGRNSGSIRLTSTGERRSITRREGVLGVHSLDRFGLVVPDLETAARFYGAFGLDAVARSDGLQLRTAGNPHGWAELREGPRKALRYLSFGAFADDMERFRARVATLGVERIDPPAGVESNGLWFRDCDGLPVEIKVAEKTSPDAPAPFDVSPPAPASRRASPLRSTVGQVRPSRLAHVLVFARDVGRSLAFYRDALGLRLSDEVPGGAAFLHAVHGSDHHVLALVKSDAPGLHHCSWLTPSIQEIGQGAFHMAEQGYRRGWGLGRHVLGSNFFHYVRDPWGSFAEYSGGSDFIPADRDWPGEAQAAEDAFYLWGPSPPKDFAFNYEAHPEALRG